MIQASGTTSRSGDIAAYTFSSLNVETCLESLDGTPRQKLSAATISAIYRERWQIGLLFKALKQSLMIIVGTSANAVRTQIWTALLAMLLIKILQQRSTFAWALSKLIALLRWNLFTYSTSARNTLTGLTPVGAPPYSTQVSL